MLLTSLKNYLLPRTITGNVLFKSKGLARHTTLHIVTCCSSLHVHYYFLLKKPLKLGQIFNMDHFPKIINRFKPIIILTKGRL